MLSGCSSAATPDAKHPEPSASSELSGELSVFAAASLQPAFEPLSKEFTKKHPGVTFSFSFDGSSALATQILSGAPADVFASADEANMKKVEEGGLNTGVPTLFATSELVIAVAPGNPLGITSLADLAKPTKDGADPTVVICAAEVPCGAASHTLLDRDKVALSPASEEQNVTAVLTRVREGEADAGLVYASDVQRSNGEVEGIPIKGSEDAAGSYLAVPLQGSKLSEEAAAFVDFLKSEEARSLLLKLGFRAP
ncbi:molybdate ABC transporter substrate-binding protein [Leucobacter viscericola]|uniref:Molybdate ABC transporter substrate-binding protein n=2 Tax=Leucobacter viscericola TaxID=2714935 RepID=A0A6G7XJZ7_9MICO|nr:molybdate ABC transporter substrate-binding protein [Leucobacter viscericola]